MSYSDTLRCMALTALLVHLTGCSPEPATDGRDTSALADDAPAPSDLVGTWVLDRETQEWLPRACVLLDFASAEDATFDVTHEAEALYVTFNNADRTVWRSSVHDTRFDARQILPTTKTGGFCGRETIVRLRLREAGPGVLNGVWQTPSCNVCPDRHFGATRVEDGHLRRRSR